MAYCTISDIKKTLPEATLIQLADDENQCPAAVDAGAESCTRIIARIDEAITGADAEIDAYCGKVYRVPIAPVPRIVTKVSADIATYNLYARRTEEIPKTRADRYKNAIAFLKGVAEGTISLGVEPAPAESAAEGGQATGAGRTFTKGSMRGY
jgi:phage gp36-like protein